MTDARRRLPQVERLAQRLEADADGLPRPIVVDAARTTIERLRARARRGEDVPSENAVTALAREELERRRTRLLRPVLNATGVVLHTNLGRAPLSREAIDAVARIAAGFSNLELDLTTGRRGDRSSHAEPLLELVTGAQAALVVNNNAAAVMLVCAALARGRGVVISRGELIEIGGEFRIPDVLAESGAVLREVGTTNRTHLRDYERAIGPETGLVLRVHPSNYRVVGFTRSVPTEDLAALARRNRVPFVYDVGSGLVAGSMGDEPAVTTTLRAGADLVCFSGDKLLGGPQAGIVCGKRTLVARLRTHPLMRAIRPGKMTLAALEATAAAYLEGALDRIPVHRMLTADPGALRERCRALADTVTGAGFEASVAESESMAGGGSLPEQGLPGPVVRLTHPRRSPAALAAALRAGVPPVLARVEGRALVLDLRTVEPDDDERLAGALVAVTG